MQNFPEPCGVKQKAESINLSTLPNDKKLLVWTWMKKEKPELCSLIEEFKQLAKTADTHLDYDVLIEKDDMPTELLKQLI